MNLHRIISLFAMASGPATAPRGLQFIKPETGWRGFVDTYIKPQVDLGVRRFMLHCPFGRDPLRYQFYNGIKYDTRYRYDQYLAARAEGFAWLTDGFDDEIGGVVKNGAQIIAYIGSLPGVWEWDCAAGSVRSQWRADAVAPFTSSGCDLGLDSAAAGLAGSWIDEWVSSVRAIGFRVYVEAIPKPANSHWASGDIIAGEAVYQNAIKPENRPLLIDPKTIQGELVRGFWDSPPAPYTNYADWYRAKVPDAINKDGHTVCLQLRTFLNQGGKLEEIAS